MKISPLTISYILIGTDIIVNVIIIFAIMLITKMQIQFSLIFDSKTVEARDFTVMITSLPLRYSKIKSDHSLKFTLWCEIQHALQMAKVSKLIKDDTDTTIVNIEVVMKDNSVWDHTMQIKQIIQKIKATKKQIHINQDQR